MVENGVRRFTTYRNVYEIFDVSWYEAANPDNPSRSPFANFMIRLKESSYTKCEKFQSEAIEKCQYQQRAKLIDLTLSFHIDFTPNFPDISCL